MVHVVSCEVSIKWREKYAKQKIKGTVPRANWLLASDPIKTNYLMNFLLIKLIILIDYQLKLGGENICCTGRPVDMCRDYLH